jgi:hypothetical protein
MRFTTPQKFDPNKRLGDDWERNWPVGQDLYPEGVGTGTHEIDQEDVAWTRTHPEDEPEEARKARLEATGQD